MTDEEYDIIEFEFNKFIEYIFDGIETVDYRELAEFLRGEADYYEKEAELNEEDEEDNSENDDE